MYSILHLDGNRKVLIDEHTTLPALLAFRYSVGTFNNKAGNTQIAHLTAFKKLYEFWEVKFNQTLDFSFHRSGYSYDGLLQIIEQLPSFALYLEHGGKPAEGVTSLPTQLTHEEKLNKRNSVAIYFKNACTVLHKLIDIYMTMANTGKSADELKESIEFLKGQVKRQTSERTVEQSHEIRSYTVEQVKAISKVFAPSLEEDENGNQLINEHNFMEYRNYFMYLFALKYGLRIGEILLLKKSNFKANHSKSKYFMFVDNLLDDEEETRISATPDLKTKDSKRVLQITKKHFLYVTHYFELFERFFNTGFLISSGHGATKGNPLAYKTALKVFKDKEEILRKKRPELFDETNYEYIKALSPHPLRHTWAYENLDRIYQEKLALFKKAGGLDAHGILEEAKSELRTLGGWSVKSEMPSRYAARFIRENANRGLVEMRNTERDKLSIQSEREKALIGSIRQAFEQFKD